MSKKKKIIIISICAIIAIVILGMSIYFATKKVEEVSNEIKLSKLYEKMMQNETYRINFKLNDDNKYTVSRKGDVANVDTYSNGTHTTDIVRDGNTYLLMYSTQKYYTYENNESELNELPNQLNEIAQSQEPTKGEEEINGEKYKYEEYKGVSYFLIDFENELSEEETNTKFYFDGDELKYIRTIMGDDSELIQVDASFTVDNSLFEIPDGFEEG